MLATVASFAFMQVAGRKLQGAFEYDAYEVLFFRSAIGVVLILPTALIAGGLTNVTTRRPFAHLTRNVIHFCGQFGWFYGIAHLAMADVTALTSTTPVLGVTLAVAFLGERLTWPRAMVIGCGFLGVIMVLRPGVIPIELAAGVTLFGAFCYAVSITMVKAMTATEPPLRVVFFMMAIQSFIALALMGGQIETPVWAACPWLLLVGVCGLSAHYCMTKSLTMADASVVMPINFLQLPVMAIAGLLIYSEGLDPFTLAGGALILAASYLNILWSRRHNS